MANEGTYTDKEKHLLPTPTYAENGGRWSFVCGRQGYPTRESAEEGYLLWLEAVVLWHRSHDPDTKERYIREGERVADEMITDRLARCLKKVAAR